MFPDVKPIRFVMIVPGPGPGAIAFVRRAGVRPVWPALAATTRARQGSDTAAHGSARRGGVRAGCGPARTSASRGMVAAGLAMNWESRHCAENPCNAPPLPAGSGEAVAKGRLDLPSRSGCGQGPGRTTVHGDDSGAITGRSVTKPIRAWQPLFGGVLAPCRKRPARHVCVWRHATTFVRIGGREPNPSSRHHGQCHGQYRVRRPVAFRQ